jgi:2-succinyl-6-hydroxy-2,4-cyclohexadiene-1-carboxylate synthase
VSRVAVNGVCLNLETTGEGPALLLLHGFTGSAATWAPFRERWPGFTLIAPDLLGHGTSDCPVDSSRYSMERCVEDLCTLLDRLGVDRVSVLGYSMGGRVALHLALAAPERLSALILESASPGIENPRERAARRDADDTLAAAIEREGVESFIDHWEALPLFASQARLPTVVREKLRRQRLASDPRGLANSLRGAGAGAHEPLWSRLAELSALGGPALLIVGDLDEKYCAIARRMTAATPDARLAVVPEAGHAVHLEQPAAFADVVRLFLATSLRTEQREGEVRCH